MKNGNNSEDIIYQPNQSLGTGLGLSWRNYGLSYSWAIKPLKDTDEYGKTVYMDIQFNYYNRKFGFDIFFQRYKGYYLEDTDSYNIYPGGAGAIRPDLATTSTGVNFFYIFSDNFSYKASFNGNERQTKSSGSFLFMASINNININSDYSLIPPDEEQYYGSYAGFKSGNFTSFSISPGYAYTFIFKNWYYVTPSLCMGTGLMKKEYTTSAGNNTEYGSFIKYNFRMAVGYSNDLWFYGLSMMVDGTKSMSALGGDGISVNVNSGFLEIYAGYRI